MSDLFDNYGQLELTCSFWLIKDDSEILKINCDFEDCLLNWMVGVFYFIKLFQKKKFKTRKCNILVLPARFMNELYIHVYYFMWQVVFY